MLERALKSSNAESQMARGVIATEFVLRNRFVHSSDIGQGQKSGLYNPLW